jgi:hypothetical protein
MHCSELYRRTIARAEANPKDIFTHWRSAVMAESPSLALAGAEPRSNGHNLRPISQVNVGSRPQ